MKTPVPSAMIDDLRALGLDAKNLPPIEKLEPRTLRGVMKLMAKSLGVRCGDCHQEGDYAAPTRRKKIAAHMWDEFAAKLLVADAQGQAAPLFCDSCHQGRTTLLDRRDKKALSKWMDDNFAAKLTRKDGKSEECESCHVDMEMHFLAQWGQSRAGAGELVGCVRPPRDQELGSSRGASALPSTKSWGARGSVRAPLDQDGSHERVH